MDDIVGIDLGTTNSLIGIMDAGFPILIADSEGRRLTPSVVHFPKRGEPIVGWAADRMRALAPEQTVYSVKRLMGRRPGESERDDFPYPIKNVGGQSTLEINGRTMRPDEISAMVLRKLKANATAALGREVNRAVITVPAYF